MRGQDFLASISIPTEPSDLICLARDRLRGLVTPGLLGYQDSPEKKATEAMKASVILRCAEVGQEPTRDKRKVPGLFEELVPAFPRKNMWRAIWSAYRNGGSPPAADELQSFVSLIVTVVGAT